MLFMRHCLVCDREFAARAANHRLCSIRCRMAFHQNDPIRIITVECDYEIPSDVQSVSCRIRGTDRIRSQIEGIPALGST